MSSVLINPFRFGVAPEFASLYESFNPLTTLAKSHFVEWFSGDALDSIWTFSEPVGTTGSQAMVDVINEGLNVEAGTTAADEAVIGFNQFRHYTHDSSVVIGVMRRVGTCQAKLGLIEDQTLSSISGANESAYADQSTGGSLSRIKSADGTTHSQTNSDLPHDTNFHSWKLTLQSSDILLDIDGILKVTKTTNRPTRSMQPFVSARSNSNGAGRNMHVTYFEAYNL